MTGPSSLREQLSNDLKQAMKDRDVELRDTIRFILSAVKNVEIDKRSPLTPEEEISLLRTQAKQRRDSIDQFRAGGRDELADREAAQLAILERYLPQQMSDDELAAFVKEGIAAAGAEGPKDMGKVMGLLNKRAEGRVDGRRLSTAVRESLAG
ncbi:MAG: GatB/YqeY domain-containing protein [Chloroflexota bacterium]|nr:GatB/YqeY domain-containing protein [Chloroflexota bacterium]